MDSSSDDQDDFDKNPNSSIADQDDSDRDPDFKGKKNIDLNSPKAISRFYKNKTVRITGR